MTTITLTDEQVAILGRAMAREKAEIEARKERGFVTREMAARILGVSEKTLYNKNLPHNQYGWRLDAILAELTK